MGSDQPSSPSTPAAAPSVQETSAEAIQAQIDALPKILEAQKQYGDQFSQVQLDSLNKWADPYAKAALDLEQKYAPQYKAISDTLNPEIGAAQTTLTNFLNQTDDQEYNDLKKGVLENTRAGQSQRGLGAISPLGSIDESVQLQQLKSSLKDRRLNIALSTAGRTPIGGMTNVTGTTGTGQLVQNASSSDLIGYQSSLNSFNASIFGTQANIFGTQSQAATATSGQNVSMINAGIGQVGSLANTGAGAAFLMCWVAAEIFGGMHEEKTQHARLFLNTLAPKWLKKLYRKHGFEFANFISDKPIIKNILRPIFDVFSSIGERMLVTYGIA